MAMRIRERSGAPCQMGVVARRECRAAGDRGSITGPARLRRTLAVIRAMMKPPSMLARRTWSAHPRSPRHRTPQHRRPGHPRHAARRAARSGAVTTTLVTGTEDAAEGNYLALHGRDAQVEVIPDLGREIRPLGDLRTLWTLMRLIRRVRPDVVHTHTAKAGAVGRLAAILCGVPVIVHTFHGHVLSGISRRPRPPLLAPSNAASLSATDRLLTVTDRVRDELLKLGVGRPERTPPCRSASTWPAAAGRTAARRAASSCTR